MPKCAIWLAALALVAAGSLPAQPPPADDIETITRDEIERSGAATLSDYLRRLPLNSLGSFRPGLSIAPLTEFSLHGLGGERTLLLINGHPAPISAVNGRWQNLSSIPLALVERIEIRNIASGAAQGSGAMTGSINIVLRRLPDGVEVSAGYADPKDSGGAQQQAAALFGISGERGSFSVGAAHELGELIHARDRSWVSVGRSTYSNNFLTAVALDPVGAMTRSGFLLTHPTQGSVVPGGCNAPGFSLSGSGSATRCLYDFSRVSSIEPEIDSDALHADVARLLSDDWRLTLVARFSRVDVKSVAAPDLLLPELAVRVGSPNHPATRFPELGYNPGNALHVRHRFVANGNRTTRSEDQQSTVDLGLIGQIGAADVEFRLFQNESRFEERISNQIVPTLAQQAITDGSYNIYDPFATPRTVLESISATAQRDGRYQTQGFDAAAILAIGNFAAGVGQLRATAQYLDESYRNAGADPIEFQTLPRPESAGRSLAAIGLDASLPLLDVLSMQLGVRQDSYSDSGDTTSGQVLLAYAPAPGWRLHASFGRGMRAPDLAVQGIPVSYELVPLSPPVSCALFGYLCDRPPLLDEVYAVDGQFGANPDLSAERTQQTNFGIEWATSEHVRVALDGWHTRIEGTFARLPGNLIAACALGLEQRCPRGVQLFPAGTLLDPALGMGLILGDAETLPQIQFGYGNAGTTIAAGADLRIEWRQDFGDVGSVGSALWFGWIDHYEISGANRLDVIGQPSRRARLDTQWTRDGFTFSWLVNTIGGGSQAQLGVEGLTDQGHLPSWTTHDLQARWRAPWNAEISVGVRNIGDREPVIGPNGGDYYANYDGNSRTPYVQYRQRW